jgi:carboxypeptidase family protein
MKILLPLIALLWAVGSFSQQSASPHPSVLLHEDPGNALGGTGAIYGVVIDGNGQPASGITVTAFWLCPKVCQYITSSAVTNKAGKYRFDPVTFGKYVVSVGEMYGHVGPPSRRAAAARGDHKVQLSSDHPEAEVRFEVRERGPLKKGD